MLTRGTSEYTLYSSSSSTLRAASAATVAPAPVVPQVPERPVTVQAVVFPVATLDRYQYFHLLLIWTSTHSFTVIENPVAVIFFAHTV